MKYSVGKRWQLNKKALKGALFGPKVSSNTSDYEDITEELVLRAPITDLIIIQSGEPIPDGYYRLSRTMRNKKAALNAGLPGGHLYLCLRKAQSMEETPITALIIVFPDQNEVIPPGRNSLQH